VRQQALARWLLRQCSPSAPTIPQHVHTIRGPNDGTGTSSGQRSALSTAPVVAYPAAHVERPHARRAS
jgi:hypothetical protein